jgi:hypothetical protein
MSAKDSGNEIEYPLLSDFAECRRPGTSLILSILNVVRASLPLPCQAGYRSWATLSAQPGYPQPNSAAPSSTNSIPTRPFVTNAYY